jgi:hypothetical protein
MAELTIPGWPERRRKIQEMLGLASRGLAGSSIGRLFQPTPGPGQPEDVNAGVVSDLPGGGFDSAAASGINEGVVSDLPGGGWDTAAASEAARYASIADANAELLRRENAASTPVTPPKPRTRAIRLPNGTYLFTNNPDADTKGGEEMSTYDAGRAIRTADRLTPSSRTMSALMNASRMASTDVLPEESRPTATMTAAVPEQERVGRQLKLEEVMGGLEIAKAQQAKAVSEMTPAARAELENPAVVAAKFGRQAYGRDIQTVLGNLSMDLQTIATPGNPDYIPIDTPEGVAARSAKEQELQAAANAQVNALLFLQANSAPRATSVFDR